MSTIHTIYPEDADPEFLKAQSDAKLDYLAMEAYKRLVSMRRLGAADAEGDLIRKQIQAELSRRRGDSGSMVVILEQLQEMTGYLRDIAEALGKFRF